MRKFLSSLALLLVGVALGVGATWYYLRSSPLPNPSAPVQAATAPDASKPILELGTIQPDGGVVDVAVPPGFRLDRFAPGIEVGAEVKAGDVLAYLDGHDQQAEEIKVIEAQIAQAEKVAATVAADADESLRAIEAQRQRALEAGRRQEQATLKRIELLTRSRDFARTQLEALEGLDRDNTIPRSELLKQQAALVQAQGELDVAQAELKNAREQLASDTSEARIAEQRRKVELARDRALDELGLEVLRRKLAMARAALERTQVLAPRDGTILELTTKPGESGAAAPLLKMGDVRQMYVLAEVYEDDMQRVGPGQEATITARGLTEGEQARKLKGVVERVGHIASGRKLMPMDPTDQADSHVFPVWIRLVDPADSERVRNYSLLRVDVAIDVSRPPGPAVAARRAARD